MNASLCLNAVGYAGLCAALGGLLSWAQVAPAAEPKSEKVLRHVVLFKFKDDLKAEQVTEVVEAFAQLPKKIDTITDFEWGTDVSVEQKAAGYTHCFLVTFATEKGRDDYLPHAAHQAFVELVKPRLAGVLVFDYWAKK